MLVGIAVTVLAVSVLGVRACADRSDGGSAATTSVVAPTVDDDAGATTSEPAGATTTVSISVLPDWYPKQSSRYSDRQPAVTVTTLPPTTTTEPGEG